MPVFHPHGLAAGAMSRPARRGFFAMLVAVFREARALEHDAYKRGMLINR